MVKYLRFSVILSVLLIIGCVPTGTHYSIREIPHDSIEAIANGQPIPGSFRLIKGHKAWIYLRDKICPCSGRRILTLSISGLNDRGIAGTEKFNYVSSVYNVDYQNETCKPFLEVNNTISDVLASYSQSQNRLELIWEAEKALGPVECDPIRAKILVDKAKQVAVDEGNLVLFDRYKKAQEKFLSRQSVEIKWEDIKKLEVRLTHIDWDIFLDGCC